MHWRNPNPCASALVTRDGTLLLVRRNAEPWLGCWDVPGGFCEPGEHPILTAQREVREETGLRIRITGLLGIWTDVYDRRVDERAWKATLNIYFHAVPAGAGRGDADRVEVAEVGWFAASALPAAIAFPHHVVPVLRAWRAAHRAGRTVTPLPDRPGGRVGKTTLHPPSG